jgi:hypothetical protein
MSYKESSSLLVAGSDEAVAAEEMKRRPNPTKQTNIIHEECRQKAENRNLKRGKDLLEGLMRIEPCNDYATTDMLGRTSFALPLHLHL